MKEKIIYNYANNNKDTLIVAESGISGSIDSSLVRSATTHLKRGGDILSIQYCSDMDFDNKNYFQMKDLTLAEYKNIFEQVYSEINGKKYKKIIYIGHSFQALVSLYILNKGKEEIKSKLNLILWDPSTSQNIVESVQKYFDKIGDSYQADKVGKVYKTIFSKRIIQELKDFDSIKHFKSIKKSTLMICAENAGVHISEVYLGNKSTQYTIIKNSGHMFGATKCRRELLKVTREYIERNKVE